MTERVAADAAERPALPRAVLTLMAHSFGVSGRDALSAATGAWLGGLRTQLPEMFWVHEDQAARAAAGLLGAAGFVHGNRIFLGDVPAECRESVLRHELVHLAQVQLAARTGCIALAAAVEGEAVRLSRQPAAAMVEHGADPARLHAFFWFVAIGIGLYVLLHPTPANAPGPHDKPLQPGNDAEVLGEALCLFAVPGGVFALAGRIGLGFLASSALAGAATSVSLRGVHDVATGKPSPARMYLTDAGTGAVIGFIVPGGFRLIGKAGTFALDQLATRGMTQSDIAVTKLLSEQAAQGPLTAEKAQEILRSRGMIGNISKAHLDRRSVIVLYRGQGMPTQHILSPIARLQGVAASKALVAKMQAAGVTDPEIAGFAAKWHDQPVPAFAAPEGFAGQTLGGTGIPTTGIPGIAANFGPDGVIYIIRIPKSAAIAPLGWSGLQLENELIILNQVPKGSIVQMIPGKTVAPLMVDENGLLVHGH